LLAGVIGICLFLLLVVLGVPIALALLAVGFGGLVCLVGFEGATGMTGGVLINYIANYTWAVIPMFVFMGQLGYHTGLLTDIFKVAREWLGRLPGGLAISVEVADSIFAACSGSSISACVVVGQASIPLMRQSGYSDAMATGVVAAGGTIAALIPPSIAICIYGLIVEESIGKLLIAGIIPGIVTAIIYIIFILIRCRKVPKLEERTTWKSRFYSIRYLWIVVVIIIAIMGGIYNGICTPTEGGAVGAFVVFALALATRRMNWNTLWQSLRSTALTTGMILIIIVGAMVLSRFLVLSGFSAAFNTTIAGLGWPTLGMFMIITAVYFILGCFVGGTAMLVMTLPIFYPLMMHLGFDSLWFGIICVKYIEMAVITPPVGVNLYAVKSIAPDIPLSTITRGAAQFLAMDLLTIMVYYFFPQIVLFLPSLM